MEAETDTTSNDFFKRTIFRLAKPALFRYNDNLHCLYSETPLYGEPLNTDTRPDIADSFVYPNE